MAEIGSFTPEQARMMWQDYLSRRQTPTPTSYPVIERTTRRLQVILSADLFAAVNTKRDPSTSEARILRRLSNGDLSLSTDTITIVNRFLHISVDAGTYAKAEWIDGEWQLYAADCATGSSSGSV